MGMLKPTKFEVVLVNYSTPVYQHNFAENDYYSCVTSWDLNVYVFGGCVQKSERARF